MSKQEIFDPSLEAELTYLPDWNHGKPFIIRDFGESLLPLAEELQAQDAALPKQSTVRTRKVAEKALESLTQPIQTGLGRIATDLKTIAYDKVYGTDIYTLVREKRNTDRNLAFMQRLGLVQETHCAKHERLAKLARGMLQ